MWIRADKLLTINQALVRKAVARLDDGTVQETRRLGAELVRGMRP